MNPTPNQALKMCLRLAIVIICLCPMTGWSQSSSVLPSALQAHFDIASASIVEDELVIVRAEDKVIARKIGEPDPQGFIEVIDYSELTQEPDGRGGAVIRYDVVVEVPVQSEEIDEEGKTRRKTRVQKETRSVSKRIRNVQGKKVVLYRDWVQMQSVAESDGRGGIVSFAAKDVMRDLVKTIENDEELIRCKITTRLTKKVEDIEAYNINGELLDESVVRARLVEQQPVILLSERQKKLDPFTMQVINPKLLLIYSKN